MVGDYVPPRTGGYVQVVDGITGERVARIEITTFYHIISFSDATHIKLQESNQSDPTTLLISSSNVSTLMNSTPKFELDAGSKSYLLGVNYPWLNYAHDFGATAWGHDGISTDKSKKQIDADFAYLKDHGVKIVRWFVFGDGRAAPEFNSDGNVSGFDEYFYADLDAAIAIAQKYNIYLILVLFDFHLTDKAKIDNGVQLGGRSQLITEFIKRQSFFDNALKPMLERYGSNETIAAWEVMNEPEGAMDIPDGRWTDDPVTSTSMQSFIKETVQNIHSYSSQYATVGSASRRWLSYWTNSNLDFYQYHYYDKMEDQYPLEYSYTN